VNRRRALARIVMSLLIGMGIGWGVNHLNWTAPIERQLWSRAVPSPVETLPDSTIGHLRLFVLAGQSNMSGRGQLDALAQTPLPGAFVFGNDYRWNQAREPIDDTSRQVDLVSRDAVVGVSPGRSFAAAIRDAHPEYSVGLIPCAKGGSSIHQWQPDLRETTLYGSCLKRVQAASVVGTVDGILFFQGETDALTHRPRGAESYSSWNVQFEAVVSAWRDDLNRPNLPVVFAQIGTLMADSIRFSKWKTVQENQRRIDIPNTKMVRTEGLPVQEDGLHYTTAGYRAIGQRMATAYSELIHASASGPSTESP